MIHSQAVRADTYALMLTTDENENKALFGDITRRMKIIDESVANLSNLSLDATAKAFLDAGRSVLQQYRDVRGKVQELAMANKNSEAYAKFQKEALPLFEEYQRQFRTLSEYLRKSAEELDRQNASDAATAIRLIVGISLGAVLLAVLLGLFIASRISKPLNRLREGVERFATGDLTVEFESDGKDEVARMGAALETMADRLRDSMKSIFEASKRLGENAEEFSALAEESNAGVEEARAGEAGRGFAVVAEEVRKLAEESNEAAKKIADLAGIITKDLDKVVAASENNAKDSRESSGLARETQETIRRMMEALSAISGATQDLAAVSEEQAASSEEIATAVQNIASRVGSAASSSEMVRGQVAEVATSAERVAKGSVDLAGLSTELQKLVGFFRLKRNGERRGLVAVEKR